MIVHDRAAFEGALAIESLPELPEWLRAAGPATLRLERAEALGADEIARWDALGAASATPSVFAQPWFVRAGLAHCAGGERVRLAVVRDGGGEWLGAMPLVARLRYGKAPFPHWEAWSHPNQFRGTPLVRKGEAARFWRALLDGLDRAPGRMALRITALPLGEEVATALMQVACEDGRACKIDRQYGRAVLMAGEPEAADFARSSRGKRIASLERKVEREIGPIEWRVTREREGLTAAVARLLGIEAAGWKGKAGSALASAGATRAFFAAVTAAAAAAGCLEVTELLAGGEVLASSVHFIGGEEGFGYKMAYDEARAGYGPGLLLLGRLTGHFRRARAAGEGPARIDSCSAPGQEPIGSLWPERMNLVDCGIALGRGVRRRGLAWLNRAEALYHREPA